MFSESIERQRRSVSKPRVAPGGATLGYTIPNLINPNGVVSPSGQNPVGVLGNFWRVTQGSRSFLAATLGWRTERRWRSLGSPLVGSNAEATAPNPARALKFHSE